MDLVRKIIINIAKAAKISRDPVIATGLILFATRTPKIKEKDTSKENSSIAKCPRITCELSPFIN